MRKELRHQVLDVLARHDGLCMDDAEEREQLADALVIAISTDQAEDHDGRVETVLTSRWVQSETAQ